MMLLKLKKNGSLEMFATEVSRKLYVMIKIAFTFVRLIHIPLKVMRARARNVIRRIFVQLLQHCLLFSCSGMNLKIMQGIMKFSVLHNYKLEVAIVFNV